MIGRTYILRGEPVVVLARWGRVQTSWEDGFARLAEAGKPKGAPRNVRIRRADGTLAIRPFRGLRKPPASTETPDPKTRAPAPGGRG